MCVCVWEVRGDRELTHVSLLPECSPKAHRELVDHALGLALLLPTTPTVEEHVEDVHRRTATTATLLFITVSDFVF